MATASSTDADGGAAGEPKTMKKMLAAVSEHSDGTNVMKDSIKTFSMNPDGSDKKGDAVVPSSKFDEAMALLKELVRMSKEKGAQSKKPKEVAAAKKWEFRTSPHEQFGKTLDDTFAALLHWATSKEDGDEDDDENSGAKSDLARTINVSKAFRRLTSYAEWMEETGEDLTSPPLSAASVAKALDAWAMFTSVDDKGRLVWWVDFASIDKAAVKKELSPTDSLRAFVWYAHAVLYHPAAQREGMVFVENVAKVGFIEGMTLVPMKLGVKLDRLTIGVLPVKVCALYILESPTWMSLFMKAIRAFMSKKMKKRMMMLDEWGKVEEVLGRDCIPKGFGKLEGCLELDAVRAHH